MREEQIRRMVSEGRISPREGERLLEALKRSRSGEANRDSARRSGKNRGGGRRIYIALAVIVSLLVTIGLALLFFTLRESETAGDLFKKGEQAFAEGEYEKAIDCYQAGLEKEPSSSAGYNLLGMAYRFLYHGTGSSRYRQEEIEAFEKAIELDPNNMMPLVNLGFTLYYQGDKGEAALYLEKALEVYPDHPDRVGIEEMIREADLQ
ncbi:MAG: tetratricopeptide repeat protein [Actinobacteria bacterium]|nr:tetratricopeptide repeat protein [Actinomycetota bacterium]MCG2817856.1 tetratricopeptide repeat protein [Actinomycetes bacterium]MBU4179286.1 tetratricopeptide repeat protein [Actinomycetota bacterium]MBU4217742.1 tetratricopeptide repeat protein [Actinomycetota bacterium]MBU4358945.1 tetratricopeptide repeat protein [Actinomycetota bacterium]